VRVPPENKFVSADAAKPGLAIDAGFGSLRRTAMTSLSHIARAMIIGMMIMIRRQPGHGDVA
jgi:hypothetical protein